MLGSRLRESTRIFAHFTLVPSAIATLRTTTVDYDITIEQKLCLEKQTSLDLRDRFEIRPYSLIMRAIPCAYSALRYSIVCTG